MVDSSVMSGQSADDDDDPRKIVATFVTRLLMIAITVCEVLVKKMILLFSRMKRD